MEEEQSRAEPRQIRFVCEHITDIAVFCSVTAESLFLLSSHSWNLKWRGSAFDIQIPRKHNRRTIAQMTWKKHVCFLCAELWNGG